MIYIIIGCIFLLALFRYDGIVAVAYSAQLWANHQASPGDKLRVELALVAIITTIIVLVAAALHGLPS